MKKMSRKEFLKTMAFYTVSGAGALGGVPFLNHGSAQAADDVSGEYEPSYVRLHKSGELKERGERLWAVMEKCALCPRQCGVDRLSGAEGFCGSSAQLEISSFHPHTGEEEALTGPVGSGTVYFANCNLRCVFCLNWKANMEGQGHNVRVRNLVEMMLYLQEKGCSNINLVTPTHYSAHIVKAVDQAAAKGLRIPLVYNTSGWERVEILKELDGVIDVYLPDFKYSSSEAASRYSSEAASYPEVTQQALLEMQRQVGTARPGPDGLIRRGLMVRHLVMPNDVCGTRGVVAWIAANLPKDTYVNLMSQYRPHYKALGYSEIARQVSKREYQQAVAWARQVGLKNLHTQPDAQL